MAGLDPAIHVNVLAPKPGIVQVVDARVKPGA